MITRTLLLALLCTTPLFCAPKGKIRSHVYTSSKKDFSFAVPFDYEKSKIREQRDKDQIIVSIQNALGQTLRVEQVSIPEQCLTYFAHSDAQGLADVFGRAIMAHLHSLFPTSSVLFQQSEKVCGYPAHFALISRPLSSHDQTRCLESVCIFRREGTLFVVSTTHTSIEEISETHKANYWEEIKLIAESFQFCD